MKFKTLLNTKYDDYINYIENEFKSIHSSWQIRENDEVIHENFRVRNFIIINEWVRGSYIINLSVYENKDNIEVVLYFVDDVIFTNKKIFNKMIEKCIDEYE